MADLPIVLAGPIVRRVEARRCSVWIVLRSSATVTLRVWEGVQIASAQAGQVESGNSTVGTGGASTRDFGDKLHVAVVTAEMSSPNPPLRPGTLYSYDVEVAGQSLRDLDLLKDEGGQRLEGVDDSAPKHLALGYLENRLPAFTMPGEEVPNLRLAHASCRKPHGPGFDAMAWLDDVISETFTVEANRPQQLFLTGDQIYADDVAGCLLPMLSGLAADLLGGQEDLSVDRPNGQGATVPATLGNFPADRRQKLVRELAGFTSSSASSHLLSFGEFVAMYLAVWSPRVWRPLAEQADVVKAIPGGADVAVRDHLTDWEACATEEKTTLAGKRAGKFDKEKRRVEIFRSAVPKVARALANCATYMIFDDHEVTDDWNLNGRWQNRVYSKRLGRNIVRNGVMAYAACQAWGNVPRSFTAGAPTANPKNIALLDQTQATFGTAPQGVAANPEEIEKLVGIGDPSDAATFNYRVEGPEHLAIVLDTRTRREFRAQGLRPPDLLGGSLAKQLPKAPLTGGRRLLLVVSPVPVLGPHLIEQIAAPLSQVIGDLESSYKNLTEPTIGPCEPEGRLAGVEQYDAESWVANEEAFEKLLARLAPYTRTVILSGDVHYGCSLVLDYWRKGADAPDRIVQLTSSPANNNFQSDVEAVLRSSALLQRYQAEPRPERLAWKGASSIQIPAGQSIPPGRRARMNREPALVEARRWPAGASIPQDKQPDWRWRLSVIRDQRPDSVLPIALRKPALGSELTSSDPLPGYRAIGARHALTALDHFDHLRQMVFTPNIGLIDLSIDSENALTVRHTILSKSGPDSRESARNTVHAISLAPTVEAIPTLVTESG